MYISLARNKAVGQPPKNMSKKNGNKWGLLKFDDLLGEKVANEKKYHYASYYYCCHFHGLLNLLLVYWTDNHVQIIWSLLFAVIFCTIQSKILQNHRIRIIFPLSLSLPISPPPFHLSKSFSLVLTLSFLLFWSALYFCPFFLGRILLMHIQIRNNYLLQKTNTDFQSKYRRLIAIHICPFARAHIQM